MSERFNIELDDAYAAKLKALAFRTHVNPGTLARLLLSATLDEVEPDAGTIVEILDAIPGAYERAQQGLREAQAGKGTPMDHL